MSRFQPVLLGSDFNAYGIARSFHEAYGVTSQAFAHAPLYPTRYSRIITVNVVEKFGEPATFVRTLIHFATSYRNKHPDTPLLLIACGDLYNNLLSAASQELHPYYLFNAVSETLNHQLSYKNSFYEMCERYDLPHPHTVVVDAKDVEHGEYRHLPFGFPVVMKPADSAQWLTIDFPGRKKAFIITEPAELETLIRQSYAAGYSGNMILQDFVPGGDERMRVLNAYVDQHHRVRMMFLGHPILEDPAPGSIGNYTAILPDYQEEVFTSIKSFLEHIDYCGMANFDMKYDERDGTFKLFEINLRQGRSSYVVTLNGYNLATYFVEDLVTNSEFDGNTLFARGTKLWLGVPPSIVRRYANEGPDKRRALSLIKSGQWGTTLGYAKDMGIMRRLLIRRLHSVYRKRYAQYFQSKADLT